MVRPSDLAVLRLMASSNVVACSTGRLGREGGGPLPLPLQPPALDEEVLLVRGITALTGPDWPFKPRCTPRMANPSWGGVGPGENLCHLFLCRSACRSVALAIADLLAW